MQGIETQIYLLIQITNEVINKLILLNDFLLLFFIV